MKRSLVLLCIVGVLAACQSSDEEPLPQADADIDFGGSRDFRQSLDAPPPREWTTVTVTDQTRPGEGLTIDFVEVCNAAGMGCVGLVVHSSSNDALSYDGAADGANSQDDSCTEATFVRLANPGDRVTFATADGSRIAGGAKVNVWTVPSVCPLQAPGAQPFDVAFADEDGSVDAESCDGTCTVVAP